MNEYFQMKHYRVAFVSSFRTSSVEKTLSQAAFQRRLNAKFQSHLPRI